MAQRYSQNAHSIKTFLSCPKGSSHIGSLMDFIGFSARRNVGENLNITVSDSPGSDIDNEPWSHSCLHNLQHTVCHDTGLVAPASAIDRETSVLSSSSKASAHSEASMKQASESAELENMTESLVTGRTLSHKGSVGCGIPLSLDPPVSTLKFQSKKILTYGTLFESSFSTEKGQIKPQRWSRGSGSLCHEKAVRFRRPGSAILCKGHTSKSLKYVHRTSHILAERHRRKLMSKYLSKLKDAIPPSYIPKTDQATVLAAAVNLIHDLENLVQRLQEERCQRNFAISQSTTKLTTDFEILDSANSSLNSLTDVPHIDVEDGTYGQFHASIKSSVGEVEVQILKAVNVTVNTEKRPTNQLLRLLEMFQDLPLMVLQSLISTDETKTSYKFQAKLTFRMSAKVIANRVHDLLLTLQFQNPD